MVDGLERIFTKEDLGFPRDKDSIPVYCVAQRQAEKCGIPLSSVVNENGVRKEYLVEGVYVRFEISVFSESVFLKTKKEIDMAYVSNLLGLNGGD